jgi:hypothetical protein
VAVLADPPGVDGDVAEARAGEDAGAAVALGQGRVDADRDVAVVPGLGEDGRGTEAFGVDEAGLEAGRAVLRGRVDARRVVADGVDFAGEDGDVASMRSFGIGTERLYWASFQPLPSFTSTPEPRQGPRLGVSSASSNQATAPSLEKKTLREVALKLHALPRVKKGLAQARNSSRVQRSVPSVPMKTATGVKWPK